MIAHHLTDSCGKNAQLGFAGLLRHSVYSRLAGYEDLNDAERLSRHPTFRLVVEAAQPGTPGALGWKRMQKDRERRQMGVYWLPAEGKTEIPVYWMHRLFSGSIWRATHM